MKPTTELYASLPRRIKASAVDTVIVLTLFIMLPVAFHAALSNDSVFAAILMYFPILIFEPLLISFFGATIGQYLFGIEVLKLSSNSKCPIHLSLLRYYSKIIFGGFSVVYMLFSKKHQAIHDYLAGTIVILSREKLKKYPEFSNQGLSEQDQSYDREFIYPSAIRRFMVFIIWYFLASFLIGFLVEIICLSFLPNYTIETESLPESVEILYGILLSIAFFVLAVLAAKGYLLGARKKKVAEI